MRRGVAGAGGGRDGRDGAHGRLAATQGRGGRRGRLPGPLGVALLDVLEDLGKRERDEVLYQE